MENNKAKSIQEIEEHLDKMLEQFSIKTEEAIQEVPTEEEPRKKYERKPITENDLKFVIKFKWQEAYLIEMVLLKEIKTVNATDKSDTARDYVQRLYAVRQKLMECHHKGLRVWFKTIESDDPKEKNMFKLFDYDL